MYPFIQFMVYVEHLHENIDMILYNTFAVIILLYKLKKQKTNRQKICFYIRFGFLIFYTV